MTSSGSPATISASCGELADALAHLLALVEAGERAHAGRLVGRVAEGGLRQAVAEGGDQRVGEGARAR